MGDLLVKPDPRPVKVEVILEMTTYTDTAQLGDVINNINKHLDGKMTCRVAQKENK